MLLVKTKLLRDVMSYDDQYVVKIMQQTCYSCALMNDTYLEPFICASFDSGMMTSNRCDCPFSNPTWLRIAGSTGKKDKVRHNFADVVEVDLNSILNHYNIFLKSLYLNLTGLDLLDGSNANQRILTVLFLHQEKVFLQVS